MMYRQVTVYPRVGGGTQATGAQLANATGLSPRGRGNRLELGGWQARDGSIPAWAGEPRSNQCRPYVEWVYPRVGGGTWPTPPCARTGRGLSPRGRGNPLLTFLAKKLYRSIPAWAGEPRVSLIDWHWGRVYPRVGGGTEAWGCGVAASSGLNPYRRSSLRRWWRSIWAGEPAGWTPRSGGLSPRGRGNPAP